jgi:hypothetical protein
MALASHGAARSGTAPVQLDFGFADAVRETVSPAMAPTESPAWSIAVPGAVAEGDDTIPMFPESLFAPRPVERQTDIPGLDPVLRLTLLAAAPDIGPLDTAARLGDLAVHLRAQARGATPQDLARRVGFSVPRVRRLLTIDATLSHAALRALGMAEHAIGHVPERVLAHVAQGVRPSTRRRRLGLPEAPALTSLRPVRDPTVVGLRAPPPQALDRHRAAVR